MAKRKPTSDNGRQRAIKRLLKKICDSCGERKPDVCLRPDLYTQEIGNVDGATWIACNDCDQENTDDI